MVAGQAGAGNILGQLQNQWHVGVVVAAEAVFQLVMGFAAVAAVAGWDIFTDAGGVAFVAFHAGHCCFMGSALGFNVGRWLGMAFYAVVIAEFVSAA